MSASTATRLSSAPVSPFVPPGRAATLQRQCACGEHSQGGECDSCKKNKAKLQRSERSGALDGEPAPPIVAEELRAGGQPLDNSTRRFMESRFAHDFSGVRVHQGDRAADTAKSVDALAYTVGNHVVFNRGQYAPGGAAGNRLLAHELAHVVQQSGNPAANLAPQHLRIGEAGDRSEKEAEAASQAVALGKDAPHPGSAPATVQRQAPPGGAAKPPAAAPAPTRDTHQAAPNADVVEPTTHSTSNYGLGIFESELRSLGAGSPCMLTLRLNLFFDFIDKPSPAPVTRTLWSAAEQNTWTNAFVRAVTSRWSYRYPLVQKPDPKCAWKKCNRAMPRVEVIPVPQAGNPDATLTVSHVSVREIASHAGGGSGALAKEDINLGFHTPKQVTAEHEFGHLLGLDHSRNPACQATDAGPLVGNPNKENCYGVTPDQIEDIMGAGSVVTPQDYRPFVQEMNYYTKCDWQTEGLRPKPPAKQGASHLGLEIFGVIGAVVGGVLGGILGGRPGGIGAGLGAAAGIGLGGLAGAGAGSILDWIAE